VPYVGAHINDPRAHRDSSGQMEALPAEPVATRGKATAASPSAVLVKPLVRLGGGALPPPSDTGDRYLVPISDIASLVSVLKGGDNEWSARRLVKKSYPHAIFERKQPKCKIRSADGTLSAGVVGLFDCSLVRLNVPGDRAVLLAALREESYLEELSDAYKALVMDTSAEAAFWDTLEQR